MYSFLGFILDLKTSYYPYDKVKLSDKETLSYKTWAALIKENFEKEFYVNKKVIIDNNTFKDDIYKDVLNHPARYGDYQLRPNFLIAMAVAPELFTRQKALNALSQIEKYILVKNGMGMRTLDLDGKNYNGNYDNSDDSNNFKTAHGYNYHNVYLYVKSRVLNGYGHWDIISLQNIILMNLKPGRN